MNEIFQAIGFLVVLFVVLGLIGVATGFLNVSVKKLDDEL